MTAGDRSGAACAPEGHCVTCSDEAVPVRVLEVRRDGLAVCAGPDGRPLTVMIELVGPVERGDELLAHAGVALARVAKQTGPAR